MSTRKFGDGSVDPLVEELSSVGGNTIVRCRLFDNDGEQVSCFEAASDVAAARRWLASLRRIDCVEVHCTGSTVRCSWRGARHRLPVHQPIPLRVGLGLATLGVPPFLKVEDA